MWIATAVALVCVLTTSSATSTTYTRGFDISWPQCTGGAAGQVPPGSPAYAVIGLTHGRGHTTNPCISAQLAWARAHGVAVGAYLVPSFPGRRDLARAATGIYGACGGDRTCRLRNDGARQAMDALTVLDATDDPAPMVWVDVEFRRPQPWSHAHVDNVHVLEGVFHALDVARVPFGVYSTAMMWRDITGGWRVDVPNWLPGGSGSPSDARRMCTATATGGATWLVQYTRSLDEDLTCPVMDATRGHPGPLWRYRTTVLRLGSAGAAVRALQGALGDVAPTGDYDIPTAVAVTQFQVEHQLPVNAQVDSDDWRALGAFAMRGAHPFLLSRMVRPR
jgi:hypothetical protein